MNKKADISLSINMIVVLIIGIVILGLALGFIRGMFGGLTKDVEELANNEPVPDDPSVSEPITLSSEHKIFDSTDTQVMKIKVLNPTNTPVSTVHPGITCKTITFSKEQVNDRNINSSETVEYLYILETNKQLPGTYLCQVKITLGGIEYSQDFDIEIQG